MVRAERQLLHESNDVEQGTTLGARVRLLRTDRRMTLRDLASSSGLSASLLSQLEHDKGNPRIATLQRVAGGLGVSVFALLPDDPTEPTATVVRPESRRKLVIQDGELRYELLSPDTNHKMEVWVGRLGPGAEMGSEFSSHPSEEFILVMSGLMSFSLGGQVYELSAGSAIQYDGAVPHRIENAGTVELVFLSALTPPTL